MAGALEVQAVLEGNNAFVKFAEYHRNCNLLPYPAPELPTAPQVDNSGCLLHSSAQQLTTAPQQSNKAINSPQHKAVEEDDCQQADDDVHQP